MKSGAPSVCLFSALLFACGSEARLLPSAGRRLGGTGREQPCGCMNRDPATLCLKRCQGWGHANNGTTSLLSVQQKKHFSFSSFLIHGGLLSTAHWTVSEDAETLCSAVSKLAGESRHSSRLLHHVSNLPPVAQGFFHWRPGIHCDELMSAEHTGASQPVSDRGLLDLCTHAPQPVQTAG